MKHIIGACLSLVSIPAMATCPITDIEAAHKLDLKGAITCQSLCSGGN